MLAIKFHLVRAVFIVEVFPPLVFPPRKFGKVDNQDYQRRERAKYNNR